MSWSTIQYGELAAHAHDNEQEFFMHLAPAFLNSTNEYKDIQWLQDWKAYWIEHRESYVNGASDIEIHSYLATPGRVSLFQNFLTQYKVWIENHGELIPLPTIRSFFSPCDAKLITEPCKTAWLIAFVDKINALLDNGSSHPSIFPL